MLRAKGFEVADFEVEEDEAPAWSDLFRRHRRRAARALLLHRRGTGLPDRLGVGLWLGAFLMDLGGGHFSRAVRGAARRLG